MEAQLIDEELEAFIASLQVPTYAKVLKTIDLLGKFSNQLAMPHSRALGSNLFELRTRGNQEIRIFYTFHQSKAVLLHGFIKKTEKTPNREITIARAKMQRLLTNI